MNKIIRIYNQNRLIIWTAILVIIGVFALVKTLNGYYKNNTKEESSSTNISTTTYSNPNYSVISKTEINEDTSKDSEQLIKSFFDYCNTGKIEEAYNLLSSDCKQELYPNIDSFISNYYNKIFTETKMYNSMLWISNDSKNTYRLEIMGDILATGTKETMPIEDYYTVSYENGNYYLSINRYIGKEEINVSKTQNDITIKILSKGIYSDYEKYEVEVKNGTQNSLTLNTKKNVDSIYVQDENELKYVAFLNEISEYDLDLSRGETKKYDIKFNRSYKPTININKIVFGDINFKGEQRIEQIEIDI